MARILVENSKVLAIITVIMSIPLFLSYNIKHVLFPEGLPFVFLFSWGLVSVFLVPILLLIEIVVLWTLLQSPGDNLGSIHVMYTICSICVAILSIAVFYVVRVFF